MRDLCFVLALGSIFSQPRICAEELTPDKARFVLGIISANKSRSNLIEYAAERQVYAFNFNSDSRIDRDKLCMNGVWRFQDQAWENLDDIPLPDVIYDYSFYTDKSDESKALVEDYKEYLKGIGVAKLNPTACMEIPNNKQKFSKAMLAHGIAHPETKKFTDKGIRRMLRRHTLLFLKPRRGNKGSGIIVIKVRHPGSFDLSYRLTDPETGWRDVVMTKLSYKRLRREIQTAQELLGKADKTYLVQEGIPSWRYLGKSVDLRINVQRNRSGELQVAGRISRVGGNLAQGGQLESYHALLAQLARDLNESPEAITKRLDGLALATFRALEKTCEATIGEIGMDIVIDPTGAPHIIEANDKPGYLKSRGGDIMSYNPSRLFRTEDAQQAAVDMDIDRNKLIIDYASFLAQQDDQI